jgi:glycosyltransferase involved in cell wall biosynthesis
MNTVPRIAIDARPLSHPQNGGFRAYVRSLVQGFADREAEGILDVQLLLYLDRPLADDARAPLPKRVEIRVLDTNRAKTDFLLFARQVRQDKPDLIHGTVNYLPVGISVPATLTLHDAMGIKTYDWSAKISRTLRQRLMHAYWAALTRTSAGKARRIITVSHGAATELAETLKMPSSRFAVIYNGITLPQPQRSGPRPENVALAIASPDLRKNLDALYRAVSDEKGIFSTVPMLHIVCTNRHAAGQAEAMLKRQNIQNYRLLCNLNDAALADAYAGATVFVWPSRMEGFGMPPLEAMRTGCPVVSSSAPVMPEILGDVPRYFDPERPDELARELNALLVNRRERMERSERGRVHSREFTCRRMADQTMAVWHEVLQGERGTR